MARDDQFAWSNSDVTWDHVEPELDDMKRPPFIAVANIYVPELETATLFQLAGTMGVKVIAEL